MIKLQRRLKTEPIKLIRRKKPVSAPLLQRRRKAADSQEQELVAPKERKSGTKKKESIIINNNKKNLSNSFTSFTSFQGPSIPVQTGPEEAKQPLSKKQRRARLSFQEDYHHKQKDKNLAPTNARVTRAMEEIFKAWDQIAYETSSLVPIKDKKRDTKKFKGTCSLIQAFLNGKLPEHKLVVVPKYFKRGEVVKKTPEDFKEHLQWFKSQLVDKNYKPLHFNEKVDLSFFLAGAMYTKFPSILLAYCWKAPESQQTFEHSDDLQFITEPWKLITGTKSFSSKDLETFDNYLVWALPHFKRLRRNLDSLKNFDDEVDVMSFLTFGVLRNMKEKGKSFSPGILNQEFFRTMMEELRKKHGYTV